MAPFKMPQVRKKEVMHSRKHVRKKGGEKDALKGTQLTTGRKFHIAHMGTCGVAPSFYRFHTCGDGGGGYALFLS